MVKIDKLIRSRRRSIGLMINANAELIVRAPLHTPVHEIERLVSQKERWINDKQEIFRKRQPKAPKQFIEGEEFVVLGNKYPLRFVEDLPKAIVLEDELLKVHSAVVSNIEDHLNIWYRNLALETIRERVAFYAGMTGLSYSSIKVNEATTRWGSCSYKDTLNFTWRLIMAPMRVVDYVVVHELMHLKHMNHSARFWAEVAKVIPDYKSDERYLKDHGHLLHI